MRQRARTAVMTLGLVCCLALAGCLGPALPPVDLSQTSQDPMALQARTPGADWQLPAKRQTALAADYRTNWFSPWLSPRPDGGIAHLRKDVARLLAEPGFGENRMPIPAAAMQTLVDNAGLAGYPSSGFPGITLAPCDLRLLPSARPSYETSDDFPFDRVQQTSLPLGASLFVHHYSRDRAWALVQSPLAWGWLPTSQVGLVSPEQMRQYMDVDLLAVTGEEVPLYAMGQHYLGSVSMGTLLPLAGQGQDHWQTLAPVPSGQCGVELTLAILPLGAAARFPLPLSASALGRSASGIMGQPYGWGGLFGRRDCSATLRDLFAPFGLWLPRNSFDQAHQTGRFIDLAGMTARQKTRVILKQGRPWRSLLWMPGHIMLYLGAPGGEPLALHNIWALRAVGNRRMPIGRLVITGLEPGSERWYLARPDGLLINRIEGLTILLSAP